MSRAVAAPQVLVATRNRDKLEEIRAILPDLALVSLDDLALSTSEEEEAVEAFSTFRENALAKARYWARRTGLVALADDSGIVVPALDGLPGVRSKRFAQDAGAVGPEVSGQALDDANNRLLLERLRDAPEDRRRAYYVCAAARVEPGGAETVALGTWAGTIARAPAGEGGFGYDPLFVVPGVGCTAAQLPPGEKERRSHRARALRALAAGSVPSH